MRSREGGITQPLALEQASGMIHVAEEVPPTLQKQWKRWLCSRTALSPSLPSFTSFVPAHWYACEIASIAATTTTAARHRMGIFQLSSHRFTYYLPRTALTTR